jgi:hypothetical protein
MLERFALLLSMGSKCEFQTQPEKDTVEAFYKLLVFALTQTDTPLGLLPGHEPQDVGQIMITMTTNHMMVILSPDFIFVPISFIFVLSLD